MHKTCFLIIGGPGVGKSTQCKFIEKKYGFHHVSVGDLLRQEIDNKQSNNSLIINEIISNGEIVPDNITVNIIKHYIMSSDFVNFLIDGFPRNINNAKTFIEHMNNVIKILGVVIFECTEEIMINRLVNRMQYSDRIDDNIVSIKKRINIFNKETIPVIKWLQDNELHIITIDANTITDDIQLEIIDKLDSYINFNNIDP